MTRIVEGNKLTLIPDEGKEIQDKRTFNIYSVVVCKLNDEQYFEEIGEGIEE